MTDTHWAKTWLLHPDAPTVHKPEVIENLHEKIGSKMGFTHITEWRKEMTEKLVEIKDLEISFR